MLINSKEDLRKAVDQLLEWDEAYNNNNPLVSDKEYDDLYFQVAEAENNLGMAFDDSPTQRINYEVKDKLEKVTHDHKMLSLAKTKDWNEFINYFNPEEEIVIMPKLDGLTCSLRYVDGKLVGAETRGNGEVGEDILHNVKHLRNVPYEIDYKEELVVDGEIISTYDNFAKFENEYSNPRNFASGSIRLLDSKESARRGLIFIAWKCIRGLHEKLFTDELKQLALLGFEVVGLTQSKSEDTIKLMRDYAESKGLPIDGLVARYNNLEFANTLGATAHHEKSAYAFKFYDDEYDTILRDIAWSAGRTGIFTPVAIFDPVDTGDSIIERASLHNLTVMHNLKIFGPGQRITVCKMNEIIPQVVKADEHVGALNVNGEIEFLTPFIIPDKCPFCGEPLSQITENESTVLKCLNEQCSGKLINNLVHYCSKSGLDIKGLSESTLNKFIDLGLLNSLTDLYLLHNHREELIALPGFGIRSVDKLLDSIQTHSTLVEPWRFLSALGIPLIGVNTSKDLMKEMTLEDFLTRANSDFDFSILDNIGAETNEAIHNFDYSTAIELLNNYVTLKAPEEKEISALSFVITGAVPMGRSALTALIEYKGFEVKSRVTHDTTYLICNDINSTSSKAQTARQYGIPIITVDRALELINE